MEFTVSPDGKWLVFIYEKELKEKENPNYIATINVEEKKVTEPTIIAKGSDFYSRPVFSKTGQQLAWKQWSHPYMPWDSTELYLGSFTNGKVQSQRKIAGGKASSIGSLVFADDGSLLFTMDFAKQSVESPKNYYNIYKYSDQEILPVTKAQSDFSQLQVFGNNIFAVQTIEGESSLTSVLSQNGNLSSIESSRSGFSSLKVSSNGELFAITTDKTSAPQIRNLSTNQVLKTAYEIPIDEDNISLPQQIKFPTSDGEFAYGYLYLPKNKNFRAPDSELPPVRVILHGGPTGSTSTSFSMSKAFWTSQGFAIFDVNYRGSTGYGRKYRDALLKKWGILEVQDVKDGLDYLRKKRLIGEKAFVAGGSAGGYSVQRLLTYYPNLFHGGASYFGIGNLVTLQKLTHKFESRYLVQLIGGSLEDNAKEYKQRSPINHLDKLAAPMIIFQGSDDKVVPPENSREMARILEKQGVYHEYYEYEGEGHGFRIKKNMVESLSKEANFFKKILHGEIKL